MKLRKHVPRPTRKAVAAAFNSQRPLEMDEKPLERKKAQRRNWDESVADVMGRDVKKCEDCKHFWAGPFGGMRDCNKYARWKTSLTCDDARNTTGDCGPEAFGFELPELFPEKPE